MKLGAKRHKELLNTPLARVAAPLVEQFHMFGLDIASLEGYLYYGLVVGERGEGDVGGLEGFFGHVGRRLDGGECPIDAATDKGEHAIPEARAEGGIEEEGSELHLGDARRDGDELAHSGH